MMTDAPNENELASDEDDPSEPTTELILEPIEEGSMPEATDSDDVPDDDEELDGEQTDPEQSDENTAENESEP